MRVLFVDHTAKPGGAELCLLDTVAGVGEGAEVVLFEDGVLRGMLERAGALVQILEAPTTLLAVRRDGRTPRFRLAADVGRLAIRLARHARRFDILYANSQKAMVVASLAGLLARRPVVWHLHDLLTDEHFGRDQVRVAVGLARRLVRRVIANSCATRDAYVAAGGPPEHVRVVYNSLDPMPFDAVDADDAPRLRTSLGVGDAPLVGLFGRLSPWKGHAVLLDALAELPGVHALLVGGALFEGDCDYPEALRARIEALGLAGRVHETGFRDDVPALMRACDVIVHASTSAEPFGRVIVEGMLAGRPVVATAAGGATELVEDGATGLLVPPADPGALASAIRGLLSDPARANALSAAGREAALRLFAPARIRQAVAAVLDEALGREAYPPNGACGTGSGR